MSRSRYSRASLLNGDDTVITTPVQTTVTVTTPVPDDSSLDLDPAAYPLSPLTADDEGDGTGDPELDALLRQLEAPEATHPDQPIAVNDTGDTKVFIDQPGGAIAPDVTDDMDVDTADEIADDTADAIDDSADEIAQRFEGIEQRVLLAEDIGSYGLSASGLIIGRQLGLLSGAAFDGLSSEALVMNPLVAGSREAVLSQEALINTAMRGALDLGERAMSHIGGGTKRLLGMVNKEQFTILPKIEEMAAKLKVSPGEMAGVAKERAANAARAAVDAVRGHVGDISGAAKTRITDAVKKIPMPDVTGGLRNVIGKVQTAGRYTRNAAVAVAVVGALAGAAKLFSMFYKGVPAVGTKVADMHSWFAKVRQGISQIKWPFGKLSVKVDAGAKTVRDSVGRLFVKDRPATGAKAAMKSFMDYTVAAKEWTLASLSAFKTGFMTAMNSLKQSLTGAGEGFIRNITNGFRAPIAEGAGRGAAIITRGAFVASIFAVFALVASVLYFVVAGGCRIIRKQLA